MSKAVKNFIEYFENLSDNTDYDLSLLYDKNIIFQDPIKKIEGLSPLKGYFNKLNKNVESGRFEILSTEITGQKAFIQWKMHVVVKKPTKKKITADGISIIHFNDKITFHRDYFDAGQLFYEHIPLIGGIIRFIKKKL